LNAVAFFHLSPPRRVPALSTPLFTEPLSCMTSRCVRFCPSRKRFSLPPLPPVVTVSPISPVRWTFLCSRPCGTIGRFFSFDCADPFPAQLLFDLSTTPFSCYLVVVPQPKPGSLNPPFLLSPDLCFFFHSSPDSLERRAFSSRPPFSAFLRVSPPHFSQLTPWRKFFPRATQPFLCRLSFPRALPKAPPFDGFSGFSTRGHIFPIKYHVVKDDLGPFYNVIHKFPSCFSFQGLQFGGPVRPPF